MRVWTLVLFVSLSIVAAPGGVAADDAAATMLEAQRLYSDGDYAKSADAYERYIRAHPKGKDYFNAHVGAFNARVKADDDAGAKKAGKRLFKRYPEAKGTFPVLSTWLEKGWKTPTLATSYKVLEYWAFDRVNVEKNPDLRLAFLDIIAKQHKRSNLVKDAGIFYFQGWAHNEAGRHDEAIELGRKYMRAQPRGRYLDRARVLVARALLGVEPARIEEATKLLRLVADNEKSKWRNAAKDLLATVGAGAPSIQLTEGFPTAEGLGQMVVLTNLSKGNARRKAIEPWIEARKAQIVRFRDRDVRSAASRLRKHGAEYVAVVIDPKDLDNNFQLAMLELCRGLDKDPMPDFHFGYLVSRDADDLGALTKRILEKEAAGGKAGRDIGMPTSFKSLAGLDFLIHYGHGNACGVIDGLSARQVAELTLPNAPVIISGACFGAVCARTHERYIMGNFHGQPRELAPNEVLSLAWIHAGATGLLAALDGDRGEMASAEWEHFREHAPALGAVIGYQYRLVFTSLRESYEAFPRYTPGKAKDKSFYGVMLRGQTSRILISDPMYRPLHEPLSKPTTKTAVTQDRETGAITVRIEMLRGANGWFINTLTNNGGIPFRETRLYARVALPRAFEGTLDFPKVDAGGIEIAKVQAKHEIWGGRRYVNVQAESRNWKLTRRGTVTTFTFAKRN